MDHGVVIDKQQPNDALENTSPFQREIKRSDTTKDFGHDAPASRVQPHNQSHKSQLVG
jgi:hypothetical protein